MRRLVSLALLALFAFAARGSASDNPEPPGALACKLFGKWTGTRMLYHLKRYAGNPSDLTYTFRPNQYSHSTDGTTTRTGKMKLDATRSPIWAELIDPDTKLVSSVAIRIEKEEMCLAFRPGKDRDRVDFTGADGPILVLKREKK